MQTREKQLLVGLVAALVLWQGATMLWPVVVGPISDRQAKRDELAATVSKQQDEALARAKLTRQLGEWRMRSLPPDAVQGIRQDAMNAQRLYLEWLTETAHREGLKQLRVTPARQTRKEGVYVAVGVEVQAEARYEEICRFLAEFYEVDLLHRISRLRVESLDVATDPLMRLTIEAEALALTTTKPRQTLFPQTLLGQSVAASDETLTPIPSKEFPTKPEFTIRLGDELMIVTKLTEGKWTVTRGYQQSPRAEHANGAKIELVRARPEPANQRTIRELVAANVFVKPPLPKEYRLRLGPTGDLTATRGKPFRMTLSGAGHDPGLGRPSVGIASGLLPGMSYASETGEFTWTPAAETPAGVYELQLHLTQPDPTATAADATLSLTLRDPNSKPTLDLTAVPRVYLGRTWNWKLPVSDAETAAGKLKFKVENTPGGDATVNSEGVLVWTPPETLAPGSAQLRLAITDDGQPPATEVFSIPLVMVDDAAQSTYLVGIFGETANPEAWFYDRVADRRWKLQVGDTLDVGEASLKLLAIETRLVLIEHNGETRKWAIGQPAAQVIDN